MNENLAPLSALAEHLEQQQYNPAISTRETGGKHPGKTNNPLEMRKPTHAEMNHLIYAYMTAAFEYGASVGRGERPPAGVERTHEAEGRLRLAYHILAGTYPTDTFLLETINKARRADGHPEIPPRGAAA
jgi:hypothetical protein